MKTFISYALICFAIVLIIGGLAWAFTDPAGRTAVVASACLAFAVQMAAFAVVRVMQPRHLMLGWGLGSVLRLVALVVYALVVAKLWRAPMTPALLSFVAFLFATTVVEPLFLKR
jgi:hypothetical protein